MDQFQQKIPPKQSKMYLWDKPQVSQLLSPISFVPGTAEYTGLYIWDQQPDDSQNILQPPGTVMSNASERDISLQCGVCGVVLDGRAQLVQHHTTAFHQHNQARVLRGLQSLSLEQFQQKNAGNTDESSLSPSDAEDSNSDSYDSDEEDENENDDTQRSPSPPSPRAGRKPRVYFLNRTTGLVVSVYRALLLQKKMVPESAESLLTAAGRLPNALKWSFLMESGGHFAGAVFAGDRAVVHKTFHSYTVRAGQGGSQGAYDSRSGGSHAKSAGASLRRYNEAKHAEHIHDILESWREHLRESDLIFIRSSRSISGVLFGGGRCPVLSSKDPRLRTVPFPTRKPTFAEIKRVHRLLAELKLHGSQEEFFAELAAETLLDTRLCPSNKTKERSRHSTRSVPETSSSSSTCSSPCRGASPGREGVEGAAEDEVPQQQDLDPAADTSGRPNKKKKRKNGKFQKEGGSKSEKLSPQDIQQAYEELQLEKSLECIKDALYTSCHCGFLKHLQSLYRHCLEATVDPEGVSPPVRDCIDRHRGQFSLLQLRVGNMKKTALHVASEKGHKEVVRWLLESGECDPSVGDSRGRVAYTYCPSKALKKVYREFRAAHPDAYDYTKSLIPAPLNEEQESVISEEKKKQRAAKKLRQKAYSAKKEQLLKEQKERERFLNLSDREKRALAAERRLLALTPPVEEKPVLQRCFQCANDISGLVPFEYSDNKFCSTTCVKLHRNDSKGRSDGNRVGGAL